MEIAVKSPDGRTGVFVVDEGEPPETYELPVTDPRTMEMRTGIFVRTAQRDPEGRLIYIYDGKL